MRIRTRIADPAVSAFAVPDGQTGTMAGTTSLYEHVPEKSRVELGMTFFWPRLLRLERQRFLKTGLAHLRLEERLLHRLTPAELLAELTELIEFSEQPMLADAEHAPRPA
ncbi:hypothetical protein AOC05_04260 [Arthrobacter alpinus]|uniref:Uncharacterized protein n=1 Tax=Arthrobacter alpinus TaxID=656366 RepID=A0A0M4RA99_9MICC|nr:hypothetical protein AOC05_04260 [Arthrobacter alpinus]